MAEERIPLSFDTTRAYVEAAALDARLAQLGHIELTLGVQAARAAANQFFGGLKSSAAGSPIGAVATQMERVRQSFLNAVTPGRAFGAAINQQFGPAVLKIQQTAAATEQLRAQLTASVSATGGLGAAYQRQFGAAISQIQLTRSETERLRAELTAAGGAAGSFGASFSAQFGKVFPQIEQARIAAERLRATMARSAADFGSFARAQFAQVSTANATSARLRAETAALGSGMGRAVLTQFGSALNITQQTQAALRGIPPTIAPIKTSMEGVHNQLERNRQATLGWGTALKSIAAFALVREGVSFFTQAANDAATLTESTNVLKVLFGDLSDELANFAVGASNIGFADIEARKAAGSFGQLFINVGLAADEAARLGQQLTERAGDIASFRDAPVQDVVRALQAALVGEPEPARRLGIFVSEQRIEQELLAKGISKTTREMTDFDKAVGRVNIIMKDSEGAAGDFTRTLGVSLPNQLRVLRAEFINIRTEIGVALLPDLLSGVKLLRSELLPVLKESGDELASGIAQSIPSVIEAVISLTKALPSLAATMTGLVEAVNPLADLIASIPPGLVALGATAFATSKLLGFGSRTALGGVLASLRAPAESAAAGLDKTTVAASRTQRALAAFGAANAAAIGIGVAITAMAALESQSQRTDAIFSDALSNIATGAETTGGALRKLQTELDELGKPSPLARLGAGLTGENADVAGALAEAFGRPREQLEAMFGEPSQAQIREFGGELEKSRGPVERYGEALATFTGIIPLVVSGGGLIASTFRRITGNTKEGAEELEEFNVVGRRIFRDSAEGLGLSEQALVSTFKIAGRNSLEASEDLEVLRQGFDNGTVSAAAYNAAIKRSIDVHGGLITGAGVFEDRLAEAVDIQDAFLRFLVGVEKAATDNFGPAVQSQIDKLEELKTQVGIVEETLDAFFAGPRDASQFFRDLATFRRDANARVQEEGFETGLGLTEEGDKNAALVEQFRQLAIGGLNELVAGGFGPGTDIFGFGILAARDNLERLREQLDLTPGELRNIRNEIDLLMTTHVVTVEMQDEATGKVLTLRQRLRILRQQRNDIPVGFPGYDAISALISNVERELRELEKERIIKLRFAVANRTQNVPGMADVSGRIRFEMEGSAVIAHQGLVVRKPQPVYVSQPNETIINPASPTRRIEQLLHEGGLMPVVSEIVERNRVDPERVGRAVGKAMRGTRNMTGVEARLDETNELLRRLSGPRPVAR